MTDELNDAKQGLFGPKPQQQEQKKKSGTIDLGGLFSGGGAAAKKAGADLGKGMTDLSANVNDLNRRVIILEERSSDLRKKIQVAEQNMLSDFKKVHHEVRTSSTEILETKKEMDEIKTTILLIIKELKMTAKKEDVDTLNKYINMWEPVNFVTQNEVTTIVREEVEKGFTDMNIKLEEEKFIEQKIREIVKEVVGNQKK